MKELPQDPPVWTPPPERWFDRYHHEAGGNFGLTARTLSAMWLTVHDRKGMPLPTKPKTFGPTEQEMLAKLTSLYGARTMDVFRAACNRIEKRESMEDAFRRLLSGKGLEE